MHPDINRFARPEPVGVTLWRRLVWPACQYVGAVALLAAALYGLAVVLPVLGGA